MNTTKINIMKRRVDILIFIYFYLNLTILKEIVSVADPETGNILSAETLNMVDGKDGGKENETFTRQVVSMATGSPPMNRLLTSGQVVHPSSDNSGLAKIDSEKETDPEDLWSFIPIRGNKVLFVGKENMCLKRNGAQISLESCPKLDKIVPKEFEWLINIQISKEDYDRCKTIVSEYEKSDGGLGGVFKINSNREPSSDKSAAPGSQQSEPSGNKPTGDKYGDENRQRDMSPDEYSSASIHKPSDSYRPDSNSDKPSNINKRKYSGDKPYTPADRNNQENGFPPKEDHRDNNDNPGDDYSRYRSNGYREGNSRGKYSRRDDDKSIADSQYGDGDRTRDEYLRDKNDISQRDNTLEPRNQPRGSFPKETDGQRDNHTPKDQYRPERDDRLPHHSDREDDIPREGHSISPKNDRYGPPDNYSPHRDQERNSGKRSWYHPSRSEAAYSGRNSKKSKTSGELDTPIDNRSKDENILSTLEALKELFQEYGDSVKK
ncbi:hypothetical protein CWI36_0590p0020 [Hamiltosporidium magnivora]|uniref:Uncharacterized protein n=1 Tax=Hamiltosporidium magnivora TaxID=148818 RepID=A0A4Q9LE29_9MICR|nr:hypothetical protein CWI36_0590p0020 [Hamiltosporidium magnivora]